MVEYLRKFNNLQALTVNDNPFCKEDSGSDKSGQPSTSDSYSLSYQLILAGLEKLKYLDYRPIDETKRKAAIEHHKQNANERNDQANKNEEANEKREFELKKQLKVAIIYFNTF